eukprot:XP_764984.1 hypothetical protein [Theileria parva strain Muguga]
MGFEDLVLRLGETTALVRNVFSENLVKKYCNDVKIVFEDHVDRSQALEGHLPKFEEVYQMTVIPTLWSDLFSIECDMLCNKLFLNENIRIAKLMANHVNKLGTDQNYNNFIQLLTHLNTLTHNITQSKVPGLRYVSGILSNLSVYNDRLNVSLQEERAYYDSCCLELLYLSEKQLLDRPLFIEKWRLKVLKFLKDLSLTFNIDKCTHNLSILFFDYYIHLCTQNYINTPSSVSTLDNSASNSGTIPRSLGNSSDLRHSMGSSGGLTHTMGSSGGLTHTVEEDLGPFKENEMLKIGTACYLLAAALREHWVDINKDKYLEQAVEMSYNAFTTKEVITVQLDIIHRMPKGFTSIYTCMEYGLFYLSNIKYNHHNTHGSHHNTQGLQGNSEGLHTNTEGLQGNTEGLQCNTDHSVEMCVGSEGLAGEDVVDDLMLSCCFRFMVHTGALPWFIPPSRCAAVFILHMFLTYLNIDSKKDLIWCRRFCHRVFKMFFDSDVALWYHVFKEIIASFLLNVEKQSSKHRANSGNMRNVDVRNADIRNLDVRNADVRSVVTRDNRIMEARRLAELKRMSEMSYLFSLSSSIFTATEAVVNLYHAKLILQHVSSPGVEELAGLNPKQIQSLLSNITHILRKS